MNTYNLYYYPIVESPDEAPLRDFLTKINALILKDEENHLVFQTETAQFSVSKELTSILKEEFSFGVILELYSFDVYSYPEECREEVRKMLPQQRTRDNVEQLLVTEIQKNAKVRQNFPIN